MKKLLLVLAVVLSSIGVHAQRYENSVGAVVGTIDGLSIKSFVYKNLAVQADLFFKYLATGPATAITTIDNKIVARVPVNDMISSYIFGINPNVMYQTLFANAEHTHIAWFAGGGLSVDFGQIPLGDSYFAHETIVGKFGFNAIAGVEWIFKKFPMALSIDARPGYGLFFDYHTDEITTVNTIFHVHALDWSVACGVRYLF